MIEFRIDLSKALEAPNMEYFLRLIWAMNDLLTGVQLSNAVQESELIPKEYKVHQISYLMRMQQAHLIEAYKACVYKIEKNPTHTNPVRKWIRTHSELDRQFVVMRDIWNTDDCKRLGKFRDNMIFHYDKDAKSLGEAAQDLTKHWIRFSRDRKSNLNLVKMNLDDATMNEDRYLIADHLVNFSFMRHLELKPSDDQTRLRLLKVQGDMLDNFLSFATDAFIHWCEDYQLKTDR